MGYSTLHLIEVYRPKVWKLPKGCWHVKSVIFKGHGIGVTTIFRHLEDLSASYDETSNPVLIVTNAGKIPQVTQLPRSDLPH
ncbi:MAG: hypothetical protein EZS28_046790 [Streblomastix strix]|uniref:Uncharacterized protein n=1 Tax=Streblomastix strix TaxID=222440 RepID=A0A5J4TIW4_9EUKA|nr:MAG: hypothetical protein EZS28_046790 [Streblomastix strix]